MAITTFTHTITLNPGETFSLPINSQILFASDPSGLESVCTTIPTTELKCYNIHWVMNQDPEGLFQAPNPSPVPVPVPVHLTEINNAWEDEDTDGGSEPVYIGKMGGMGSVVDNGTTVPISRLDLLEGAIAGSLFSGAIAFRKYKYGAALSSISPELDVFSGDTESGYKSYDLYFKSTATIAESFYLEVTATQGNIPNKARFFASEMDCEEYDVIISDITVCGTDVTIPGNTNDPIPE